MNIKWIVRCVVFLVLVCFCATVAHAWKLQEDYKALEKRRSELEQKRKAYEDRLIQLISQKKSLTVVFFQCVSPKEKDYWEAKIAEAQAADEKLETERQSLIEIRKRMNANRSRLEQWRVEIEAKHTRKTPGSAYEAEFNEYMAALEQEYFQPLEQTLFKGYEDHLAAIESNIAFLKESVSRCME